MRGKQVLESMDKSTKPHKNVKGGADAEETGGSTGFSHLPLCSLCCPCHCTLAQQPLLFLWFMVWISHTDNISTDSTFNPSCLAFSWSFLHWKISPFNPFPGNSEFSPASSIFYQDYWASRSSQLTGEILISFPIPLHWGAHSLLPHPHVSLLGLASFRHCSYTLVPPLPAAFPALGWVIAFVPLQRLFHYSLVSLFQLCQCYSWPWAPKPRSPQQNSSMLPEPGSNDHSLVCLCKHAVNTALNTLFLMGGRREERRELNKGFLLCCTWVFEPALQQDGVWCQIIYDFLLFEILKLLSTGYITITKLNTGP